jgi:hypothetical protein
MILSTSLELNPSLYVFSRDCIAALSGFAAGLSAATALADARMAAQSAVTVRMLIPLQISAISVISCWMLSLPCSKDQALTLRAPTYLPAESAQIEAHANGSLSAGDSATCMT